MFVKYSSVFLLIPVTLASEMSRGWMLDQSIGINVGVAFHKVKEIKDVQSEEEKKESEEERKKRELEEEIEQAEREKEQAGNEKTQAEDEERQAKDEKERAEQDRAQLVDQLQLPGNLQGELDNANTAYRNADKDAEKKDEVYSDVCKAEVICSGFDAHGKNVPVSVPHQQVPVNFTVHTSIGEKVAYVVGTAAAVGYILGQHGAVGNNLVDALRSTLDRVEQDMRSLEKVEQHGYTVWVPGDDGLAQDLRDSFRALRQALPGPGQVMNHQVIQSAQNAVAAARNYLLSQADQSLYNRMQIALQRSENAKNQADSVRDTCLRDLGDVRDRLRQAQQLAPDILNELGTLEGKISELTNKINRLRERSSGAERRESAAAAELLSLQSKLRRLEEELSRRREGTPEEEVPAAPVASNIPVSRRKAKPVAEIEYAFACRNSKLLIGADVIVGGMIGKVEQCSGFYYAAMPKVGLMLTKDVGLYVAAGIRRGKKTSPIVGAGIRCDISPKMYAKLEFNRWWTSRVRANVIKVGFGFRF